MKLIVVKHLNKKCIVFGLGLTFGWGCEYAFEIDVSFLFWNFSIEILSKPMRIFINKLKNKRKI